MVAFTAGQRIRAVDLSASPVLVASASLLVAAASIPLTIPSGYNRVHVYWRAASSVAAAAEQLYVQLNGDTGSNYLVERAETNNTTTTGTGPGGAATTKVQIGTLAGASRTALYMGSGDFVVDGLSDTTNYKTMQGTMMAMVTVSNGYVGSYSGQWNSTSAVTSLALFAATGNLVAGSTAAAYALM